MTIWRPRWRKATVTLVAIVGMLTTVSSADGGSAPNIEVVCGPDVVDINHGPEEEWNGARAVMRWKVTNANAVWISGQRATGLSGTENASSKIISALGPGGLAQVAAGCNQKVSAFPGRNGLKYSYSKTFDPRDLVGSYTDRRRAALSLDQVDARLTKLLQQWGYTAAPVPGRKGAAQLIRYTPQYNALPGLCDKDCAFRNINKQVAFLVAIEDVSSPDGPREYDVRVLPTVMMRYTTESADFTLDPDGVQIAIPICGRLVADLFQ